MAELRPGTQYLVWAAARTASGWGAWGSPTAITTTKETAAPRAPRAPVRGTALGCHEVTLTIPRRMEAGCALDRALSVEVRAHGEKKWRLAEARTLNLEGGMVRFDGARPTANADSRQRRPST